MPVLNKNFKLEITPEQFLNACSSNELQETDLLLSRPEFLKKMNRNYRNSDNSDNSDEFRQIQMSHDGWLHSPIVAAEIPVSQIDKTVSVFSTYAVEAGVIMREIYINQHKNPLDLISLLPLYTKLERLRMKSLVSSPQPIPVNSNNSDNSD